MTDPIVPDHIRAAIHAGHVGQVVIFCDRCGIEETADYTGETREARFAAARANLANSKGWAITEAQDLCPKCNVPDQPDGIEDDSRDLPDPATAAGRIGEYIRATGAGLYDVQDGNPLYARDLEALTRVPAKLADVQEDLARTIHTLDLVRRELGATRTEADRFGRELAAANQQIATIKTHFNRRCDTLTARAERAERERDDARAAATVAGLDVKQIMDMVGRYAEVCVTAATTGSPKGRQEARDQAVDLWDAIRGGVTAPVPGSSQHAQEPDAVLVEAYWKIRDHARGYRDTDAYRRHEEAWRANSSDLANVRAALRDRWYANGIDAAAGDVAAVLGVLEEEIERPPAGESQASCVVPVERPVDLDDRAAPVNPFACNKRGCFCGGSHG